MDLFAQHQQVLKSIAEASKDVAVLELQVETEPKQIGLGLMAMVLGLNPRDVVRKELEAKRQYLDTLTGDERRLRTLLEAERERTAQGNPERIRWKAPLYALADLAANLFDQEQIEARSRDDAFEKVAAHFIGSDGQRLSAHSLRNNLKQCKDKKEAGKVRP